MMKDGFNVNPLNPCKHERFRIIPDNNENSARPGRKYKRCKTCNKFLGWIDGDKK